MNTPDGSTIVLGGTTLALLIKEGFAWLRSRSQKTEVKNNPLKVQLEKEFVSRSEFDQHVADSKRDLDAHIADNAKDHENLFGRLNRNDRETSEIKGLLTGMRDDLSAIKNKLFKTK
ncbi:MAG: hypothetical protein II823_02110 [Kiritimatiellae bacterium]|nr:hypothetical protein [Kiritimatiellia bacterium]